MIEKEEFFYRPTVNKALKGRRILTPTRENLVEILEGLSDNGAVVVRDYTIVPKEHYGIPYKSHQNFLKRGSIVHLETPSSMEDAIKRGLSALESRVKAYNSLRPDVSYCGSVFTSLRTRTRKKIHLVDDLEGARIFAFAHQSNNPRDKINVDKDYKDSPEVKRAGGKYVCTVISRSRNGVYGFTMHHVPVLPNEPFHRFVLWRGLTSSGLEGGFVPMSERKRTIGHGSRIYDGITFGAVTKEEVFTPQEMAAYFELSLRIKEQKGRIISQPFPLPTQFTVDFYLNCKDRLAVEEMVVNEKTGLSSIRRRLADEAEIEILLWDLVKRNGYEKTFYSRTKLQERKWIKRTA